MLGNVENCGVKEENEEKDGNTRSTMTQAPEMTETNNTRDRQAACTSKPAWAVSGGESGQREGPDVSLPAGRQLEELDARPGVAIDVNCEIKSHCNSLEDYNSYILLYSKLIISSTPPLLNLRGE